MERAKGFFQIETGMWSHGIGLNNDSAERKYDEGRFGERAVAYKEKIILGHNCLKELFHEIEMCWWWYGWIEPYLEMNL